MKALIAATGDNVSDIALWQFEMDKNNNPEVFRFEGSTLKGGIEYGADPRGSHE